MLCLLLIAGAADAQSQMQTIWQMAYWESYETACTIILDEDRQPTNDEIRRACGDSLYQTWLTTPACNRNTGLDGKPQDCYGLFLRRVGQKEREDPSPHYQCRGDWTFHLYGQTFRGGHRH